MGKIENTDVRAVSLRMFYGYSACLMVNDQE